MQITWGWVSIFTCAILCVAIKILYWSQGTPPGVWICVLGVSAVMITLRPQIGLREKTAWIFLAFALFFLEIYAINAEQNKHVVEIATILGRFDETQKLQTATNQSIAQLAESKAPQGSLEYRALLLSNEILLFLGERQANEPESVVDMMLSFDRDFDKPIKYSQQTMSMYSELFGPRVIEMRNAFAREGLKDEQLDRFFEHTENPASIRIIGERIGALAKQLK